MRAGKLRNRLTLQANTPTQDTFGGSISSWARTATVWASIDDVGLLFGTERVSAAQVIAEGDHYIVMRHRANVTTKQRFLWGSRIFEIVSIANPQAIDVELHLRCREMNPTP